MISPERLQQALASLDDSLLASLPNESQCDHVFSNRFHRKMQRVLRQSVHPVLHKFLIRAACVLLIISLLLGSLVAFHPAIRASVVEWVKEWVGDFRQYTPVMQTRILHSPTYDLRSLPEGYVLTTSYMLDAQTVQVYCNESQQLIRFTCLFGGDKALLLNKEANYSVADTTVNGYPAELYIATDPKLSNSILWTDTQTGNIFYISAPLAENELISLAESVTPAQSEQIS